MRGGASTEQWKRVTTEAKKKKKKRVFNEGNTVKSQMAQNF